jgi:hypothetical protein
VSVGIDHDTPAFAANATRGWWKLMGQKPYPQATRLLIAVNGGGSNGSRVRLWKVELQKLADELRIPFTVCDLPPGTSKWNKIEHRLFSFITQNWRQAARQLPDHRPTHRGHYDQHRPQSSLRDRTGHLSDRHRGFRRRNRRS